MCCRAVAWVSLMYLMQLDGGMDLLVFFALKTGTGRTGIDLVTWEPNTGTWWYILETSEKQQQRRNIINLVGQHVRRQSHRFWTR